MKITLSGSKKEKKKYCRNVFSGSDGASFLPRQDKMLNEFLTRPPSILGCAAESSTPRPSSASAVFGEKLEAINTLNFNLNLNMNGVHCHSDLPTTSSPALGGRGVPLLPGNESLPLEKAHLLRGILQGCNRAMPEGMDVIAETLTVRDFGGKNNNNMVMKSAGRPDMIGRLLGGSPVLGVNSTKRSRRESAAPPVRDRRTIKRPRHDPIIIRNIQEQYELEKAAQQSAAGHFIMAATAAVVKDLPSLRPASNIRKPENGEFRLFVRGEY